MLYFVYVLQTNCKNKKITYVGSTNNLKKRIKLHNLGKGAKFTRGRKWKLIYSEKHSNKNKALSREYYMKKDKNFRNQLKNNS